MMDEVIVDEKDFLNKTLKCKKDIKKSLNQDSLSKA